MAAVPPAFSSTTTSFVSVLQPFFIHGLFFLIYAQHTKHSILAVSAVAEIAVNEKRSPLYLLYSATIICMQSISAQLPYWLITPKRQTQLMSFLYSGARTIPLSEKQTSGIKRRGEGRAKRERGKKKPETHVIDNQGRLALNIQWIYNPGPLETRLLRTWFSPRRCSFLSPIFLFCLADNSNSSPRYIFYNPPPTHTHKTPNPNRPPLFLQNTPNTKINSHQSRRLTPRPNPVKQTTHT